LKLMSDLIKQKYKAELDPLVIAKLREACYFKDPKVTIEEAEQEAEATKIDYKNRTRPSFTRIRKRTSPFSRSLV